MRQHCGKEYWKKTSQVTINLGNSNEIAIAI